MGGFSCAKMVNMNTKGLLTFFSVFAVGAMTGIFGVSLAEKKVPAEEESSQQIRQGAGYTYINPLLECEVAEGVLDVRKENFHDDLENFVTTLKQDQNLSAVAVYFRDLNNGPTFGVGEQQEFFPASLLKVPVMMAYYHRAEHDPALLDLRVTYAAPKEFGVVPTILPREPIVPGESYTIDDLIRRMVVFSDNQALVLLTERLPLNVLRDLFALLGVRSDVLVDADSKLTVKEYASFFRILFNSSYLSRESSERALSLLASTEYNDGLPKGVPAGVVVAHKFGEAGSGEVERQLHDCGIIYFPTHPYLACIMTRGNDTETLKNAIQDISRFIYQKVDEQY